MSSAAVQQLVEQGFAGPVDVLSAEQCGRFLTNVWDPARRPPLDWPKGFAANTRAFYEIATCPTILSIVNSFLGENVMLWGASIQIQPPGATHAWHSDMETSGPIGKTASVWIGLHHTCADSGLQFVSHSHRFGATVQEVRNLNGNARGNVSTETIAGWGAQRDPAARLVKPDVTDGQALFFQGPLWHHSQNKTGQTRWALLLQYATPDTPIRIPDLNYLDWPFRQLELPRPACIMIQGTDTAGVNRIVSAPAPAASGTSSQLTNLVYPLRVPLAADDVAGFRMYTMFNGSTSDLREMDVHVSSLNHGQIPHPPHTHKEEEILIMLAGEADMILPQSRGTYGDDRHPLRPGEFVYYPAHFPHTLRTTSAQPANYLMFKWHAASLPESAPANPLAFCQYSTLDPQVGDGAGEGSRKLIFEGRTGWLRKLHGHVSVLQPGAGYPPHADAYDVAIIVLEGEIETLDQRVQPFGTIFHPAGQLHGLRNPGTVPARYVVFEFHGSQSAQEEAFPTPPGFLEKVTDPRRWASRLKRLVKRK